MECVPTDVAPFIIIQAPKRQCPAGSRRNSLGICREIIWIIADHLLIWFIECNKLQSFVTILIYYKNILLIYIYKIYSSYIISNMKFWLYIHSIIVHIRKLYTYNIYIVNIRHFINRYYNWLQCDYFIFDTTLIYYIQSTANVIQ